MFFISYALCEIPANRLLLRLGARRWLGALLVVWGTVAGCMVFVHSAASFYGLRVLLGAAESGFFPGVIFYLSQWFPGSERARSISFFYVAFPLSSTVMGVAAGALLRLNGVAGLRGWQWLFLVEALPAVLLGGVVWSVLPAGVSEAGWLSAEERRALQEAVDGVDGPAEFAGPAESGESAGIAGTRGRRLESAQASGMRTALRSGRAWAISLVLFLTLGSYYAVIFSLPVVLRGATGLSAGRVGWLVAGFGVAGAVAMLAVAWSSDQRRERRWHIVVPGAAMAMALLAAGVLLAGGGRGGFTVVALLVGITSYYAMQGPLLSLPSLFLQGEAAAVAIAMLTMGGVAGGFVGPYWMGWMREVTGGYPEGIGWLAAPCLLAVLCTLGLMRGLKGSEAR